MCGSVAVCVRVLFLLGATAMTRQATGRRVRRLVGYRVAASSEPPSPRNKSLLDICHLSKGAPFRLPKPFSDQFPAPESA